MKYVAAALILLAMAWTWSLTSRERDFALEDHKALEMQVQEAIRAAIKEKRPGVTDVIFQQLFTETIKPGEEIRARFRYQITEPIAQEDVTAQIVEGAAKLASADGGRTWKWLSEEVRAPQIEFQKGSRVGRESPVPPSGTAERPSH